jgi:hypothetical protein
MINCLLQTGQLQAGFDPFQVLQNANKIPIWGNPNLFIKDASNTSRTLVAFLQYDAGDTSRTIGDFEQDDAGSTGDRI